MIPGVVIYIVSGEHDQPHDRRYVYVGNRTPLALKRCLGKARDDGARWARAVYYHGDVEHDAWSGQPNPVGDGYYLTPKTKHKPRGQRYNAGQPGEANHRAKLTEKDIKQIRKLISRGESNPQIAARYAVTAAQVSHIRTRRCWGHVP